MYWHGTVQKRNKVLDWYHIFRARFSTNPFLALKNFTDTQWKICDEKVWMVMFVTVLIAYARRREEFYQEFIGGEYLNKSRNLIY